MVDVPLVSPLPPGPPPQPPSKILFLLKFSQEIQSLQSGHLPDHPNFDQINESASTLQKLMTDNERTIKQLCQQNGWTFDETNTQFNNCIDALKEAQKDPASLESAQSASGLAETLFIHINS